MGLILLFIMCTVCYEFVNITIDACAFFFCYLSVDFWEREEKGKKGIIESYLFIIVGVKKTKFPTEPNWII